MEYYTATERVKVKVLDGLFHGLHKNESSEHFLKQIRPASNFYIFKANKRMCSKKVNRH